MLLRLCRLPLEHADGKMIHYYSWLKSSLLGFGFRGRVLHHSAAFFIAPRVPIIIRVTAHVSINNQTQSLIFYKVSSLVGSCVYDYIYIGVWRGCASAWWSSRSSSCSSCVGVVTKGSPSWSCVCVTTWLCWVSGCWPWCCCAFVAPSLCVVCGVRLGLVLSGFAGLGADTKGDP